MSIYKRKGTRFYSYDFHFKGERIQVATHLTSKEAAKTAESAHRIRLAQGRLGIVPAPALPLFKDFAERFLDWARHHYAERPNTLKFHRQQVRTLLHTFSPLRLDEITIEAVERYKFRRLAESRRNLRAQACEGLTDSISHNSGASDPSTGGPSPKSLPRNALARRSRTVSPATVNRELSTLKFIFHQAQRWGLNLANPVTAVAFNTERPASIRVVSRAEEREYLAVAPEPLRSVALLMLETGMRPEEVFRLEAASIDLKAGVILNPRGKTLAARRLIPLTAAARTLLEGLAAESLRAQGEASGSRYLFPGRHGFGHLQSVRKGHDAAIARARLTPRFRLYDFRHTFATRAVEAGVELPVLKELLGHTDIRMTMRYVHPSDRAKREAIARIERFGALQRA